MNNNKENRFVPELRFPEFTNSGDWKEKLLCKVSSAIFDGTHQTPKYTTEGIPFFSVENIISGNKNKFISKQDYLLATSKNKPEKGDILITRIGNIGFSKIVDWDYEFSIYVTLAVVKKNEMVDSYYLHSFFQSNFFQKNIRSKSLLNAVPCKINMDELRTTKVLLPPDTSKKEQQKVAACFFSLDQIINGQIQKIEILKEHKKGLMQNLFPNNGEKGPKLRFKEFAKYGDWKQLELKKLLEIGSGKDYKHLLKGNIPVYGSGGYMQSVDNYLYDGESVCIGRKGTIDKPIFLSGKFWTVDTLFYTHSFKNCIPKFIYFIFQKINWKNYNEAGGIPSLNKTTIGKIEVYIPNLKEQQKIVECLSALDYSIESEVKHLDVLKDHKKGLMQQLFPEINE